VAYDEAMAERVRRMLSGRRDLVEKKMMGGICFMVSGNMCCGVSASALMVRAGRDAYQRMLAQPHVRPLEFAGRRPTGFVLVDRGACRTDTALARWVKRGIDFVSTLPGRKPASRSAVRKVRRDD
jgi:TfoX/Sxy family transcriptional regulator of competence genes